MSGDVQPRKRKEKRSRKKDDEDTGTPPPTLISPTVDTSAENVTIHIYKESSTGGHWCARIIFFVLLAVLAGLISIIIFEHRGTTDVDTPITSSRWASIFEGWVDDSPSNHGDASYEPEEKLEVVSQETEEAEEEEEKVKVGYDEEKSTKVKKEDDSIEQDTEEIGDEEETKDEEEEEEEEKEEREQEEEKEKAEKDNVEVEQTIDEDQNKREQKEDEEGRAEEIDEENDNDDDVQRELDATGILEEVDGTNENEDSDREDNMTDHPDMEFDEFSTETVDDSAEEKNNNMSKEFPSIPGVNEIDDNSVEPLEEIDGEEVEEENLNDADNSESEEEVEEEPTSVAVKFGVGVALVVAAHFVLVRRWNNVDIGTFRSPHDITDIPGLSRRDTIISPPHLKQIIKSIEKVENKTPLQVQVKNYEDLRSKYNKLQEENISLTDLTKLIPQDETAQITEKWSVQSTTKEEEINFRPIGQSKISSEEEEEEEEDYELEISEGERIFGTEEYDGEQIRMKNEDEQEGGEKEGEDDDEEEEIENVDDLELIAKLDAKYGKLPTPQDSEVEEEEEEEDEEEEEEEEDDDEEEEEEEKHDKMPKWKRIKDLKDSHVESQARRSIRHTEMKTKQVDSRQSKSGEKAYDLISKNTSDIYR